MGDLGTDTPARLPKARPSGRGVLDSAGGIATPRGNVLRGIWEGGPAGMEFALPPDGWGVPVCVACLSADVDMWKGRPRETFRKTMRVTQSGFAAPHVSLMRPGAIAWRVLSSGCSRSRAPASHPFSTLSRSILIPFLLIRSLHTYPCHFPCKVAVRNRLGPGLSQTKHGASSRA